MESKFEFYEIVRVVSSSPELAPIQGDECAVLGKARGEDGKWYYTLHVYRLEESWSVGETEVEATGRMDERESFYDDTSVKVKVDENTGEGTFSD